MVKTVAVQQVPWIAPRGAGSTAEPRNARVPLVKTANRGATQKERLAPLLSEQAQTVFCHPLEPQVAAERKAVGPEIRLAENKAGTIWPREGNGLRRKQVRVQIGIDLVTGPHDVTEVDE